MLFFKYLSKSVNVFSVNKQNKNTDSGKPVLIAIVKGLHEGLQGLEGKSRIRRGEIEGYTISTNTT